MKARRVRQIGTAIAIFPLFLLLFPASSMSREIAPREAVQAAHDRLEFFLKAIPVNDLSHYGFSAEEDLANATLGDPVRVYTISPDGLFGYTEKMELSSLLSPTDLWFFPVLYLGDVRTILTVDKMNGELKAVAIGSSGLARQLKEVQDTWPESEGYEHTFVRIFQAQADFVILFKEESVKMVPLESAKVALKLDKTGKEAYRLYNASDLLPELIPLVRWNIQYHKTIED